MATEPENAEEIASFLPIFERNGYTKGERPKPLKDDDVDTLSAFVQACYANGWVLQDFDWTEFAQTPEADALRDNPSALEKATKRQLAELLTMIIRQDRFVEGALHLAVESGLFLRVVRRAGQIWDAERKVIGMNRYGSQVREVINRNTFVSLALAEGFNAFLPVYDGGVDFILYRESDGLVHKVQLKGRWTIDRKYVGRDIWVAFPIESEWYLVPHDEMVTSAETDGKTKTSSWIDAGLYSTGKPSKAMITLCAPYRFCSIATVTTEAADGEQ